MIVNWTECDAKDGVTLRNQWHRRIASGIVLSHVPPIHQSVVAGAEKNVGIHPLDGRARVRWMRHEASHTRQSLNLKNEIV
jgi:hypothetical protein